MDTCLIYAVLHIVIDFKQCLLVLQAVPVTWEWYQPWQLPSILCLYGLYFGCLAPPEAATVSLYIAWNVLSEERRGTRAPHTRHISSGLHEDDLWFQTVSVYWQLSDLHIPRDMPHLNVVFYWTKVGFENQGKLFLIFPRKAIIFADVLCWVWCSFASS